MSAPTLHTIHGQPSWSFHSSLVTAHLTKVGGHLGPVEFRVGKKTVSPYSVAPWATGQPPWSWLWVIGFLPVWRSVTGRCVLQGSGQCVEQSGQVPQ